MPVTPVLSVIDEEFISAVVGALRYLFEFLGTLLRSIGLLSEEKIFEISDGLWGAIYWLIRDLNLILESFFTSTVEVEFEDVHTADASGLIEGIVSLLDRIIVVLESNADGLTTTMFYYLFDFLSYLIKGLGELMGSLPQVLPSV